MSNDWRLFFVFYLSGSDHVVKNVFQSSSSMSRHQSGTAVRIVVFKDCTNLKCGRFLARVTVPRMRRRITPYVKRCTIVSVRVGRIHTGASSSFGTTRASLVRSKGIPRKETWRTHPQSVFELAVGSSCSRLNRYYVEECHAQNKYSAYTVKRRETLTLGTTTNTTEWSKVVSGKGTPSQLLTGVLSSDDSKKKKTCIILVFCRFGNTHFVATITNYHLTTNLMLYTAKHSVFTIAYIRVSTRKHSPEKKVTTTPGHCPGKRIIVTRPTPESSLGTRGQRRKHETPADGTLLGQLTQPPSRGTQA